MSKHVMFKDTVITTPITHFCVSRKNPHSEDDECRARESAKRAGGVKALIREDSIVEHKAREPDNWNVCKSSLHATQPVEKFDSSKDFIMCNCKKILCHLCSANHIHRCKIGGKLKACRITGRV